MNEIMIFSQYFIISSYGLFYLKFLGTMMKLI